MPGSLLLSVAIVTSDSFQSETELLKRKKNREIERERPEKTLSHNNKNCGSTVCESPLCGLISNFCIILVGIINTEPCLRRFIEPGCISIEKHPNQYHYWSSFGVGTFKGVLQYKRGSAKGYSDKKHQVVVDELKKRVMI